MIEENARSVSRRKFTATMVASLGAGFSSLWGKRICEGEVNPPNIIFLLADDLRHDALGCMGNPIIHTPHIDALARDGVVFENAYVTTSICAPSRATILSGQYVCRHGINDFSKTFSDEAFKKTYPALLRRAGYVVGFIGKYGIGDYLPEDAFDYWCGFTGQGYYEQTDASGGYRHLTRIQGEQAVDFLQQFAPKGPFCLSLSFKAPHSQDEDPRQFIYDPFDASLYDDVVIPRPEYLQDTFETRFPEFFRKNNEGRIRWQKRFSTPELFQQMVKAYYRLITGIDRVVGTIRQTLEMLNVADTTVIIFTSDNGFFLGDHGLADKWFGYEKSIRVPLIIYDPTLRNSRRGTHCSEIALNTDIAPTVVEFAGIVPPETMQGYSLIPLIRGIVPHEWRQDFYYEHTFDHPGIPKSEGVVSKRFKYLRYFEQHPPYEELFDLQNDPNETNNLSQLPEYAEVLNIMRARLESLKNTVCA